MGVLPVLFFILIGILVIAGIWYGVQLEKKRRQALGVLAQKLGMSFDSEKRRGLAEQLGSRFATLTQGSNRYAFNILAGRHRDHPVVLFDFHHETYSTDSKGNRQTHHHHRSFVTIEHDVDLGALEARPEHFFDKVKGFFGFDDIDFESAEFSKAYFVKAKDRKLAYDLFRGDALDLHQRSQRQPAARDGRPSGRVRRKVLDVHRVHRSVVVDVREEDGALDDILQRRAGRVQYKDDVVHRLTRLGPDAALHEPRRRDAGECAQRTG